MLHVKGTLKSLLLLLAPRNNSSKFLINHLISFVLIGAAVADMMLSTFYRFAENQLTSSWGILLFAVIALSAYGAALSLLSIQIKQITLDLRSKERYFNLLYKAVSFGQFVLAGVILALVVQVMLKYSYPLILLNAATTISFVPASIILVILGHKFLLWFRSEVRASGTRNPATLFFGMALLTTAIGAVARVVSYNQMLLRKPMEIGLANFNDVKNNMLSQTDIFSIFLFADIPLVLGYVLMWIGAVFLLRKYSQTFRKTVKRYWVVIISLTMVSLLVGLVPTMLAQMPGAPHTAGFFGKENLPYFIMIFKVSVIVGGLLFSTTYLLLANSMRKIGRNLVANYLSLSAYGTVLLAVSFASSEIYTPFPPFGATSFSFVALSAFMTNVGIYYAVRSVSVDAKLRESVRKLLSDELGFMRNIAIGDMEQNVEKTIDKIAREYRYKPTAEEEEFASHSYNEDEIRQYLEEVMTEINKKENSSTTF